MNTYFDVAISYATPDNQAAAAINAALRARNFKVFYDRAEDPGLSAEMWARNLDDYLSDVFRDGARFCLILVSSHYVNRGWTDLERKAARSRQIKERRDYILPVTLDGTLVPNMDGEVHLDYRIMSAEQIAEAFDAKHRALYQHHDIELSLGGLTPVEPRQHEALTSDWRAVSKSAFNSSLNDGECAWVLPMMPGRSLEIFDLTYDARDEGGHYDSIALPQIGDAVREWGKRNPERYQTLKNEGWGGQVRLSSLQYDNETYRYHLHLKPIKYLHYLSTHARLWSPEVRPLRERVFKNALHGLFRYEELLLPSHFCIHMAVISNERKALIRQRRFHAELFPGAWEVGMGEFMHGPDKSLFPSFDQHKKPDLSLFLRNSIAEEVDYHGAKAEDFSLYGFAVEYRTLAPKLLVVYQSDLSIDELIDGARRAKDFCQDATFVRLTPIDIAGAMKNKARFSSWGPTSKLVLWLALGREANTEAERRALNEALDQELASREE